MKTKQLSQTILVLSIVYGLSSIVHSQAPLATENERLWAQAARPMDGLRVEPAKQYSTQPIIIQPVTKDGLMLLDRKVRKTGEWIDTGRERCYGHHYRGPGYDGGYVGDVHCHREPPRRVEEFAETSKWQIVDREAYVQTRESRGRLTGGLLGGLLGGLIGLASALLTGLTLGGFIIFPLLWLSVGIPLGMREGGKRSRNSALEQPEVFTETRRFTKSHPI